MIIDAVFNFIYVGILIAGAVVLTLIRLLMLRENRNRLLEFFLLAMFVYMCSDFVAYCFVSFEFSIKAVFVAVTISDILCAVLMSVWLYYLSRMTGRRSRLNETNLTVFTVWYILADEIPSVLSGGYNGMEIEVGSPLVSGYLMVLGTAYSAVLLIAGIRYTVQLLRRRGTGLQRRIDLFISISFAAYAVWIGGWDYMVWFVSDTSLSSCYILDPIYLIYAGICIGMIWYFYRKDPLRLAEEELAPEAAVQIFSVKYGLTDRETEVLRLINEGKTNPQIGEALFIAENTVKRHVNSILKKTSRKNRHDLLFLLNQTRDVDRM